MHPQGQCLRNGEVLMSFKNVQTHYVLYYVIGQPGTVDERSGQDKGFHEMLLAAYVKRTQYNDHFMVEPSN